MKKKERSSLPHLSARCERRANGFFFPFFFIILLAVMRVARSKNGLKEMIYNTYRVKETSTDINFCSAHASLH